MSNNRTSSKLPYWVISASICVRDWLPVPMMLSVFGFLFARYFDAMADAAPVLMSVMWVASMMASGAPVSGLTSTSSPMTVLMPWSLAFCGCTLTIFTADTSMSSTYEGMVRRSPSNLS